MSDAVPPSADQELYAGLRALAEAAFPKRCRNCGRVYADAAEFIAVTVPVQADKSGLKASVDDDGTRIVELFRNCVCGSTLMDGFSDRRDVSEAGLRRRQRFDELMAQLARRGIAAERARTELLKLMRGQPSELLALIKASSGPAP